MIRLAAVILTAFGILCNSTIANAAFIYGVDSSTLSSVAPGTSGTITVFLNNTGAPTSVDTYQTALNVTSSGATYSQLGLGSVTFLNPFNGILTTDNGVASPNLLFGKSLVLNAPASITLASGRTDLYTLPFTIAANTAVGSTFTFDIVASNPGVTDLAMAGVGSLSPTFSGTEFTLTVVPEPASLGLGALGLAFAGSAVRKWRKRKLTA